MLVEPLIRLFARWGMLPDEAPVWATAAAAALSVLVAWLLFMVLTRGVIPLVNRLVRFTSSKADDLLLNPRLLRVVAELASVILLTATLPGSLVGYEQLHAIASVTCRILVVCTVVHLVNRFILALYELLEARSSSRVTSLKGIRQMLQIISVCIGVIIILSILAHKNPVTIITGLGAAATVLMLVFKDSIMGVVAGVQLTLNDMVRPGDWITVPSRNLNGTVIEVGLTTVKVQNFDNTIVTIPPYSLVSESFQNWRGMTDAGGRRVQRSVTIDVNSVTFCTPEMIEEFRSEPWGKHIDPERRHVNLTLYRQYLEHFISTQAQLNTSMTYMVRELEPTATGVPIEMYLYTTLTSWKPYEHFMASLVDHILATVGRFGLKVYQAPSGSDILKLRAEG